MSASDGATAALRAPCAIQGAAAPLQADRTRALEAQRSMRYDALLQLITEIERRRVIREVAEAVAARWKHCASITHWRLQCAYGNRAVVISARGRAVEVTELDVGGLVGYDAELWREQRPRNLAADALAALRPTLVGALADPEGVAMVVLPMMQGSVCVGMLSALSREGAFDQLDRKFISLVAGIMTARIVSLLTEQTLSAQLIMAERALLQERLEHAAFHDELTDLSNRTYFRAALDNAITQAQISNTPVAVVLLDVDQLTAINDACGQAGGDEALRCLAQRLDQSVRAGDVLARVGSDEFGVLLTTFEGEGDLPGLIERLRSEVLGPMTIADHHWVPSCCFGSAIFPRDAVKGENLMRCAEMALARAKREGPGTVSGYDMAMHAAMRRRGEIEGLLREALDQGTLAVHYQPLVRLADRRIIGAEALVRMPLAGGGQIPPVEFIPVAEACGLIDELGNWVLRRALEDTKALHDAGFDALRVAVNLSAIQLQDEGIAQRIGGCIRDAGFNPERLELELTESVLIGDTGPILTRLGELRALGASLSVDDFGTGYSSLSYLRRLPVGKLKIDRSFVQDITDSRDAGAIVEAVLSLARSLRLSVVAEGVETEVQAAMLTRLRCEYAQGYLFSKPVPAPVFAQLVREGNEAARHSESLAALQPS